MTALQKSDAQTGHTPGPWRAVIRANQAGVRFASVDMPNGSRSFGKSGVSPRYDAQDAANARLIAAAPDGLELAEDALPILEAVLEDREEVNGEEDEILRCLIQRTRAFIAKATGAAA